MAGREDSVKAVFDIHFRSACRRFDKVDVVAPLNGLDRNFNADTLFSTYDKFFIIEFKSAVSSIKSENRKKSVCHLCCGLFYTPNIAALHDQCHFMMWGVNSPKAGLSAEYDIYRKCVCNISVLPACIGSQNMKLTRQSQQARLLAGLAGKDSAGLNAADFRTYLEWLLGSRTSGSRQFTGNFRASIYATSDSHALTGYKFDSIDSLYEWANSDRPESRNDDWSDFEP